MAGKSGGRDFARDVGGAQAAVCAGLLAVAVLAFVPICLSIWPSEWTIPHLRPALFAEALTPRKVLGLGVSDWWLLFSAAFLLQTAIREGWGGSEGGSGGRPQLRPRLSVGVSAVVCAAVYAMYVHLESGGGAWVVDAPHGYDAERRRRDDDDEDYDEGDTDGVARRRRARALSFFSGRPSSPPRSPTLPARRTTAGGVPIRIE